jgi:hypothetical protein
VKGRWRHSRGPIGITGGETKLLVALPIPNLKWCLSSSMHSNSSITPRIAQNLAHSLPYVQDILARGLLLWFPTMLIVQHRRFHHRVYDSLLFISALPQVLREINRSGQEGLRMDGPKSLLTPAPCIRSHRRALTRPKNQQSRHSTRRPRPSFSCKFGHIPLAQGHVLEVSAVSRPCQGTNWDC